MRTSSKKEQYRSRLSSFVKGLIIPFNDSGLKMSSRWADSRPSYRFPVSLVCVKKKGVK